MLGAGGLGAAGPGLSRAVRPAHVTGVRPMGRSRDARRRLRPGVAGQDGAGCVRGGGGSAERGGEGPAAGEGPLLPPLPPGAVGW